jgi:hypothetical protein
MKKSFLEQLPQIVAEGKRRVEQTKKSNWQDLFRSVEQRERKYRFAHKH